MDICPCVSTSVALLTADAAFGSSTARIIADEQTLVTARPWSPSAPVHSVLSERPDVAVLDCRSSASVFAELRALRRLWPTMLVFVANARTDAEVRAYLDAGADDACVADPAMLTARLHAMARHARTVNAGLRVAIGDVVFEREARRVWCAGAEVRLTPIELCIVDCLFWHAPKPVAARAMSLFIGRCGRRAVRPNTVEVYVGYVRRKLASSRRVRIATVRGAGYRFAPYPGTPVASGG